MSEKKEATVPMIVLSTVAPPWHSVAFVVSILAYVCATMPSIESLDQAATIEVFTARVFPEYLSVKNLGIIRGCIALSCWLTTVNMIAAPGWDINTNYRPQTKLKNAVITLQGLYTLCPFTSWCWLLLTLSFSMNAAICFSVHYGREHDISKPMLRVALILWELAAPFALLVSAVVRYAIWPIVLAGGKPHTLTSARNQMQHNMNSVFALVEMCTLGGLPIHFDHRALAPMFGIMYVVFAWSTTHRYRPKEDGPQFLYWFFDLTLGKVATYALVALVTTLVIFFTLLVMLDNLLQWGGGGIAIRFICVALISSLVCRIRE